MPTERIQARVITREGSSGAQLLEAIRDYASTEERNPWVIKSRRPFVLTHRSPRAEGVRYEFSRDGDDVKILIAGGRARLGLAYAVTMLSSARFGEHVASLGVRLPEVPAATRRARR